MEFYKHSGRCGTWGVPLASAAGLLAALVLGLAYVYVVNWIPIIYVSFLATAAFGFGVGAAVAWGAKFGKMRNMGVALGTAAIVGALAVYFAWAFDPMARFDEIDRPIWSMETLWQYMKLGYMEGFWSIGGNGGAVTGPFLAAVWIIEAAMILGVVCVTVQGLLGSQPFCEELSQWTKNEKSVARLSLVDDESAEEKLRQVVDGELAALDEFYRSDGTDGAYLELDLATSSGCATCNYLTVKMISHEVNKKGEVTKQENKLLVNLLVSPEDVPRIRTAGIDRPIEEAEMENEGESEDAGDAPILA